LGGDGKNREKGSNEKQSEAATRVSHRRSVIPGGRGTAALRYSELCATQNM
jgi:hypothetical protein